MTLRVLLVINRLEDNGGAEVSTALLLDGLQGHGIEFRVVTLFGPATIASRQSLEARGVEFRQAPPGMVSRLKYVRHVAQDWAPDVIHSTLFDSDVAAAAAGSTLLIPTLTSIVSTAYSAEAQDAANSRVKLRIARRLVSLLHRIGFSHVHAITRAVASEATHDGLPAERLTILPRGRPSTGLSERPVDVRLAVRHELSIADEHFVVLNVARHEPPKGHELLLMAFARLVRRDRDALLLIAGRPGSTTPAIQAQAKDLGIEANVRLLGVRDDVARLHVAADVFAFSSRWEGLGGSVLEAMEVGTPVVGFRIPALDEVVGDAGLLVEPFDTEAFASQLEYVRDHPLEALEMADRARSRFRERYSLAQMNADMAELYERVSRSGPPPISRLLPWRRRKVAVR